MSYASFTASSSSSSSSLSSSSSYLQNENMVADQFVGLLSDYKNSERAMHDEDMIWFAPSRALTTLPETGLNLMHNVKLVNHVVHKNDVIEIQDDDDNDDDSEVVVAATTNSGDHGDDTVCVSNISYWKEYENMYIKKQSHHTQLLTIFNNLLNRSSLASSIHCKSRAFSYDFNKIQDYTSGALSFTTCTAVTRKPNHLIDVGMGGGGVSSGLDLRFVLDYFPYIQLICKSDMWQRNSVSRRRNHSHYLLNRGVLASMEDVEVIEATLFNT
jgi:hypothetical protein